MPKAYSVDLRERVLMDVDSGLLPIEVAARFRVARSWVHKIIRQRRETGCIKPRRGKTGPKPKLAGRTEELKDLVSQYPDATLKELREKLNLDVSLTLIWYTLRNLGLTLKKSTSCRRAKSA